MGHVYVAKGVPGEPFGAGDEETLAMFAAQAAAAVANARRRRAATPTSSPAPHRLADGQAGGGTAAAEDDPAEAVGDFSRAIELDPEDDDAYHERGRARTALGDHAVAK